MDQGDWRFCGKCFAMFFDGDPNRKGACPADGQNHSANGFTFTLPHDIPEAGNGQGQWRFCDKCFAMFFDGDPNRKGVCDAGGGHQSQGFLFVLPHDVPGTATAQSAWRFCSKCFVMFFDGSDNKGHCAAGAGHAAQGFMFVLPHLDDEVLTFDTGPITSNLPLGGSAHLVVNKTGAFTFNTHAHDSGFDNINYTIAAVLMSSQGLALSFAHQGSVEGTTASLPFGSPSADRQLHHRGHEPGHYRQLREDPRSRAGRAARGHRHADRRHTPADPGRPRISGQAAQQRRGGRRHPAGLTGPPAPPDNTGAVGHAARRRETPAATSPALAPDTGDVHDWRAADHRHRNRMRLWRR